MCRDRLVAVRNLTTALLLFGALWVFSTAASAQLAASDEAVSNRTAELLEILAESGTQSDAAILALEALEADNRLSLEAREQVLHDLALQLRTQSESAAARRALQWLTGYESQVLVQKEGRGPAIIPKWRVAGVARGTLTLWDRAAAAADVQRQLKAGTTDLAGALAQAESAQDARALTQALRGESSAQLLAHREDLLAMMARSDALAPAVAEAALRLQDAELCQAVFASGDKRTANRLIIGIGETMPAEKAFPILRAASQDTALASAAIVEIGKSAAALPAARDFLLETLADPARGGSAAAALAAMADDEMVFAVAAQLQATDDQNLQSKSVLMLVLDGSPPAREGLENFARRPDVSEELRREVSKWLREGSQ